MDFVREYADKLIALADGDTEMERDLANLRVVMTQEQIDRAYAIYRILTGHRVP